MGENQIQRADEVPLKQMDNNRVAIEAFRCRHGTHMCDFPESMQRANDESMLACESFKRKPSTSPR